VKYKFFFIKNKEIMIQASTLDFVASSYKALIFNVLMTIWNKNF